jgi:hypothetical protein
MKIKCPAHVASTGKVYYIDLKEEDQYET